MPRLDFEKQFARQLREQELQPSADSWKKLEARLEQEEKRTSPKFWWMGIAVTIVGALVLFGFFGKDTGFDNNPAVVDTEVEFINFPGASQEARTAVPAVQQTPEADGHMASDAQEILSEKADEPHNDPRVAEENNMQQDPTTGNRESIWLSYQESELPRAEEPAIAVIPADPDKGPTNDIEIETLLAQAMAEVAEEIGEVPQVTDSQINNLLKEVRIAMRKEKAISQSKLVNADQLLLEVETELEQSFRREVFEIIKEGIRKTRTAVVNIND